MLDVNERLARRLVQLREEKRLSLEELAARSGVSRAMISRIERAESSPTVTVLNKLAIGLGELLPTLFGPASYAEPRLQQRHPVVSVKGQPEWKDPDTGYRRRTLTPLPATQPLQLSEVHLPGGARVTVEFPPGAAGIHQPVCHQQIWMLDGLLDLRTGNEVSHLHSGDCMAMAAQGAVALHNPGRREARYLVAALGLLASIGKNR